MRRIRRFTILGLLLISFHFVAPANGDMLYIQDNLSEVTLEQLAAMVDGLEIQLDWCKEKLQSAGKEIEAAKKARTLSIDDPSNEPPAGYKKTKSIDRLSEVGSNLKYAKKCITKTNFDLERVRAEILKRLGVLKLEIPDPNERGPVRAKAQEIKADLHKAIGTVNKLNADYGRFRMHFDELIDPVDQYIMMEPEETLQRGSPMTGEPRGFGFIELPDGHFEPSDKQADRLSQKIEKIRGRKGKERRWYDEDIIDRYGHALRKDGNHQAAVKALGVRTWLILETEK